MNPLELQLRYLVKLVSRLKLKYAILGGVAVSIYGEPRLTFDLDINIILDIQRLDEFLNTAKRYGFYPLCKNIKKFIKNTGVIPLIFSKYNIEARCDFIIAQNSLEYAGIKRARLKKIYSVKVKVISPEDLFIYKITSDRMRDIEDAETILMRQKRLDLFYIRDWLKRLARISHKPELLDLFESLVRKVKK